MFRINDLLKNKFPDSILEKEGVRIRTRLFKYIINAMECPHAVNRFGAGSRPVPLVVIINGTGGVGKDTFINYVKEEIADSISVLNISTIDPVRAIPIHIILANNLPPAEREDLLTECKEKSDRYRHFLYELKKAWIHFNDGPLCYVKSRIAEGINNQEEDTPVGLIFIHCREKAEIRKYEQALLDEGFPVFTLLIKPGSMSTEDAPGSLIDKDVLVNANSISYDRVIINFKEKDSERSLALLQESAIKFGNAVVQTLTIIHSAWGCHIWEEHDDT